jgi:hypothetical protein
LRLTAAEGARRLRGWGARGNGPRGAGGTVHDGDFPHSGADQELGCVAPHATLADDCPRR